jgi:hypothetical protein
MHRMFPADAVGGSNLGNDADPCTGNSRLIAAGSCSDQKLVHYGRPLTPAWPTLATASIILTFTLKEAQPLRIPPHLAPTRAIANATMRMGPTMEDYASMASYRTLLICDRRHSPPDEETSATNHETRRSMVYDRDFTRIAQRLDPLCMVFRSDIPSYIPGSLNGLWEGTWMASTSTHTAVARHFEMTFSLL